MGGSSNDYFNFNLFLEVTSIIKELDSLNKINPKGYSKTLGLMISGFLLMFSTALILYFV